MPVAASNDAIVFRAMYRSAQMYKFTVPGIRYLP